MGCLFCKISKNEIPSDVVYEDETVKNITYIQPKGPVHILIIPKEHIVSLGREAGQMLLTAQKIAKEQKISETGYRLVFNRGDDAGQTIDHLHLHLLGGEKLPWP